MIVCDTRFLVACSLSVLTDLTMARQVCNVFIAFRNENKAMVIVRVFIVFYFLHIQTLSMSGLLSLQNY